VFVDGTVGGGGHSEALLVGVGAAGRVYGIDRDPAALERAAARLERFGPRFVPIPGNHGDVQRLLADEGVFAIDGAIADLGLSSDQLDDPARGFSFRLEGPLDMRMDPRSGATAADLLASLPESEIRDILHEFGEERRAGAIARAIVRRRAREPITRTEQLAALVEQTLGPGARRFKIHPATRTFQALRIAVNRELDTVDRFVAGASSLLRRGGRIALISFHSLEDRAVKQSLRGLAQRCICPPGLPLCGCGREDLVKILTARPIAPSPEEIERNPRSRSAKLRVAERL
jgi:16S rRNA (cytosine1402-N4)-methyltransferase